MFRIPCLKRPSSLRPFSSPLSLLSAIRRNKGRAYLSYVLLRSSGLKTVDRLGVEGIIGINFAGTKCTLVLEKRDCEKLDKMNVAWLDTSVFSNTCKNLNLHRNPEICIRNCYNYNQIKLNLVYTQLWLDLIFPIYWYVPGEKFSIREYLKNVQKKLLQTMYLFKKIATNYIYLKKLLHTHTQTIII